MRIITVIQARVGSTRLPGKALLEMAGKPMVVRVVERLGLIPTGAIGPIVVAIPGSDLDAFGDIELPAEASLFAWTGDEADVVGRHLAVADSLGADAIIRVPSDNPLVDPDIVERTAYAWRISDRETMLTRMLTTFPALRNEFPDGVGCEVHSIPLLRDSWARGNAFQREHPHRLPCAENRIRTFIAPKAIRRPDVKLDVNTREEFDHVEKIFEIAGDHCTAKEAISAHDQIMGERAVLSGRARP